MLVVILSSHYRVKESTKAAQAGTLGGRHYQYEWKPRLYSSMPFYKEHHLYLEFLVLGT